MRRPWASYTSRIGKGLLYWDAAGNIVGSGMNSIDIYNQGANISNVGGLVANLVGLGFNLKPISRSLRPGVAPRGAFDVEMAPSYIPVAGGQQRIIMTSADLPSTASIGNVIDDGLLPGRTGITLTDQTITHQQLWTLTQQHGVEFALTREVIGGRRVFRLYSGGSNFVEVPTNRIRTIAHTHAPDAVHPLGDAAPSLSDIINHNARWRAWVESGQASPNSAPFPSRVIYGPGPYPSLYPTNGGNQTIFWPFDYRN